MATTPATTDQTLYEVTLDVPDSITKELVIEEIYLTESLLVPSLQTSVVFQDVIHTEVVKNLDLLKGKTVNIKLNRELNLAFGVAQFMEVNQTIFRVENRYPARTRTLEMWTLQACDFTLLENAKKRISKSWKCSTPTAIVSDALRNCIGAKQLETESSQPTYTYFAENIHPYQVVAQQADAALAGGDDPSFLHYMTYEKFGTHHFKSMKSLVAKASQYEFVYNDKGLGIAQDNHQILNYEFPCDFDLLSDIMNTSATSVNAFVIDPYSGQRKMGGSADNPCGMGGALTAESFQGGDPDCPTDVSKYLEKRQARIALLDQDKVALRITVPWNPDLHVGRMIKCIFPNIPQVANGQISEDYGTGDYLITTMTHKIMHGGYATTTLDCVAKTVGNGIV